MPDYQNGKIYKLYSNEGPEVYIGSTTQKLCQRKAKHKSEKNCSSKILFEKYEEVIIELIEYFPCNNKEELNKREGMHIRMTDCINKIIAGRTRKEYIEDNKEHIKEQQKEYYQENAEHIKEQQKEYYQDNSEYFKEKNKKYREDNPEYCKKYNKEYREDNPEYYKKYNKKYYENNKEKIIEYKSQKMTCECGITFRIDGKAKHEKSLTHKKLINSFPE